MSTELARDSAAVSLEQVLVQGDLKAFSASERTDYYLAVCKSLNLNPLTRPFEYLTFQGRLILYARRDCTEQLRRRDGISIEIVGRKLETGVYAVSARAKINGRTDESDGVVCVEGLKGEALANAYMKAETKAKRRVTLSICGLGLLDESEIGTDSPVVTQPAEVKQLPALQKHDPAALADKLAANIATAQTSDALKELVEYMNTLVKAGQLGKPETDRLIPLVTARKAALAPAAKEGEDRADPHPTTSVASTAASTHSAAFSTASAATPSVPDDGIPKAGAAIVNVIMPLMHELGVSWPEVRNGATELAKEIAEAAALPKMPAGAKVGDLSAPEALRLKGVLETLVAAKKASAAKRQENAARKAREEDPVSA